jgi:hypothetical protein
MSIAYILPDNKIKDVPGGSPPLEGCPKGGVVGSPPVGVGVTSEANRRAESAEHCSAAPMAGWQPQADGVVDEEKH